MVTPHLQIAATPGHTGSDFIDFARAAFGAEVDMRHDEERDDQTFHGERVAPGLG